MEDQDTLPHLLVVHPEFGTIYRDGEFVQRGSVLGLAVDARKVVIAPVSGWVRLAQVSESVPGIPVEIRPYVVDSAVALPANTC